MTGSWRGVATWVGAVLAMVSIAALALSMRASDRGRALRPTAGVILAGLVAGIAAVLAFGRV